MQRNCGHHGEADLWVGHKVKETGEERWVFVRVVLSEHIRKNFCDLSFVLVREHSPLDRSDLFFCVVGKMMRSFVAICLLLLGSSEFVASSTTTASSMLAPSPDPNDGPAPSIDQNDRLRPEPAPEAEDGPAPDFTLPVEQTPPDPRHHASTTTAASRATTTAGARATTTTRPLAPAPEVRAPSPSFSGGGGAPRNEPAPEADDGPAPSIMPAPSRNSPKTTTTEAGIAQSQSTTAPDAGAAGNTGGTDGGLDDGVSIAMGVCIPIIVVAAAVFVYFKVRDIRAKKMRQNLLGVGHGVDLSQEESWAAHQL